MQLLNKTILKLPWIKFSGAILDDRMFTFLFIFFSFFFPGYENKSVPFTHSVQPLIVSFLNFMICIFFFFFLFLNERRVFIITHFSLLLSLVDYIRCIHIPVFMYLRESWILKFNFLFDSSIKFHFCLVV